MLVPPGGLGVDHDDDFVDAELPELFLDDAFDRDEQRAAQAAEALDSINSTTVEMLIRLELIERALRQSEFTSARARLVRMHVRRALSGFDNLLVGLDDARVAFLHPQDALPG